jgi:hypothetical protein
MVFVIVDPGLYEVFKKISTYDIRDTLNGLRKGTSDNYSTFPVKGEIKKFALQKKKIDTAIIKENC